MDTQGWHIHESLWGGLFSGAVGSGMPWWWDENVDKPNVYWHFQAIANFVRDVGLTWKTSRAEMTRPRLTSCNCSS